ncbi:hypothetical protein HMPREF0291_11178 [Corynebacterium genitalium ATCC 33030]|uniref:Uncharacterized protein n=1 Tax=Corynebacterium genitalium ATCC 33030 TaxID=585529 RepID=D7WEE4_9CORY|nr:hypothetical protein HMPREF0291_11178 [Corynebacterium genitalium ATCC 33030]
MFAYRRRVAAWPAAVDTHVLFRIFVPSTRQVTGATAATRQLAFYEALPDGTKMRESLWILDGR